MPGLETVHTIIQRMRDFVDQVYLPDVLTIASFYKDWSTIGEGLGNFMTYGDFPDPTSSDPTRRLVPSGVILHRNLARVRPIDLRDVNQIQEFVTPFLV